MADKKTFLPGALIAARLILGALFLYAGVPKIFQPEAFARAIYNYQILPDLLVNFAAITLPWVETVIGIFLIAGIWLPGTVLLTNLLLLTFLSAMAFNYARGLDIDCGCFSTGSESPISSITLLRDTAFFFIALFHLFGTFHRRSPRH